MAHEFKTASKTGTLNLPSLPPTWEWIPFKHLCEISAEYGLNVGSNEYQNEGTRFIRTTDIQDFETISNGGVYLDPSLCKEYLLKKGDILISRSGTVGKSYFHRLSEEPCAFASYLVRFRLRKSIESKFVAYYLESKPFKQLVELESTQATISNVSGRKFADMPVPIPESVYQRKIVQFLNFQTNKINTLIDKNQRLLELLDEKSESLITKLVTIGSSPKTQMQDSNIDWLGEIPENWDIIRTRYLCKITTGSGDTQDAEPDGEYPFVVRSQRLERSNTYTFDGEGVLTAGDGNVGEVFHHIEGKFHYHQRVYLFYDFRNILPLYFYYYMKAFFSTVALAESAKSTVDSLRRPMLLDFPVAVPPIIEQESIVESIKNSTANIDNLHSKIENQISLLEKKRQALITAAVTGQIEVSDWEHPAEEACVFS